MIDADTLTQRLIRVAAPYRISRASGVPVASEWLRQHPDGGWLQSGQEARDRASRRLLFLLWLISEGRVSDERV